jgi:hypothetical protein
MTPARKPRRMAVKQTRRSTSKRTRTPEIVLDELEQVRDQIKESEEDSTVKRAERNGLILEAREILPTPPTLETVGAAAGVANSYISRIKRDRGTPATGHENDDRKAA